MADLADVETKLAQLLGAALYPNGTDQPSAASGRAVQVLRGWPANSEELDAALAAGRCILSVFPMQGMTRNVTRYVPAFGPLSAVPITLGISYVGSVVTITGTATAGQVVGVASFGVGYAVRCTDTDTPTTIAASLAAEMPFATASNGVLTLSFGVFSFADVVSDSEATAEVGRQIDGFQVSAWCPDPASRDAVAGLAMSALTGLQDAFGNFTHHLALADGSDGVIKFTRQYVFDQSENANLYRRDLIFEVEYPTMVQQTFPAALFGQVIYFTATGAISVSGTVPPATAIFVDETGAIVADASGNPIGQVDTTVTNVPSLFDEFGNPVQNEAGFLFG